MESDVPPWFRERITALMNEDDTVLSALFNAPRKTDEAQKILAARVRAKAKGHDVIFHGTRYARGILADQTLEYSPVGHVVSFTRSPEMAAYWALLPRDDGEENGAVLILDRKSLRSRFRLEPFHDPIWDTPTFRNDEAEERVWNRDIHPLRDLLVAIVWERPEVGQRGRLLDHKKSLLLTRHSKPVMGDRRARSKEAAPA